MEVRKQQNRIQRSLIKWIKSGDIVGFLKLEVGHLLFEAFWARKRNCFPQVIRACLWKNIKANDLFIACFVTFRPKHQRFVGFSPTLLDYLQSELKEKVKLNFFACSFHLVWRTSLYFAENMSRTQDQSARDFSSGFLHLFPEKMFFSAPEPLPLLDRIYCHANSMFVLVSSISYDGLLFL